MEDVVLLDTGVLYEFLTDGALATPVEIILSEGKAAVASITVYELLRGVVSKKQMQQRNQLLSFVHTIDLTEQIAKIAGRIFTDLRNDGKLIDNEDILIAATSLYHAIPVFTTNVKHFARIPRLQLYVA